MCELPNIRQNFPPLLLSLYEYSLSWEADIFSSNAVGRAILRLPISLENPITVFQTKNLLQVPSVCAGNLPGERPLRKHVS